MHPLSAGQQLDDVLANLGKVGTEADEDLSANALALAHKPKENVLGPDVVVAQLT